LHFDRGDYKLADSTAYNAMLEAAKALIHTQFLDIPNNPDAIASEFKRRFCDTEVFHDQYAGGKFAQYLFNRHADTDRKYTPEQARYLIEETQLFIEAAYACHGRLLEQGNFASRETAILLEGS